MILRPPSSGCRSVLGALALLGVLCAWSSVDASDLPEPYTQQVVVHGVPVLATEAVHADYVEIAGLIYEHMTSRDDPYDLRALHRESGFRILLITEEESFLDLPEYRGQDAEIDDAGGLGGSIGEFHIAVRVGSPHALVHEIGHGIYHSAIQFAETGGADDEEGWYAERVRAVHGCELEEAFERFGEEQIHEVLLAPENTFSADLAAAWRRADAQGAWRGEYGGTEPNEYWAEGVAYWFRAVDDVAEEGSDGRALLAERDPLLHALCARIFPDTDWHPGLAHAATGGEVRFEDEPEDDLGPLDALIDYLDRDGDERLGAYEAAEAFLRLVDEADRNGDRAVDTFELLDHLGQRIREEQAEREEFFDELDADDDGRLTAAELPDEVRGWLGDVDRDGDGSVSLDELLDAEDPGDPSAMFEQELREFLAEVDRDGDGAFALEDLPQPERAEFEADFVRLDVDEDGQLTESELLGLLEKELGGATFEVRDETAVMTGVIGPTTPGRVLELILEHPEVERIVLLDVPGSMDDASNLRAARLVRRLGLATHVPADGVVASGGTDFYLAGARRTAEPGARFGVHSWGGFGEEGADVPRDDPEHDKYLEYYRAMGIPEDFYWYTLEAEGADDIHWMTAEELERYGFFTEDAP